MNQNHTKHRARFLHAIALMAVGVALLVPGIHVAGKTTVENNVSVFSSGGTSHASIKTIIDEVVVEDRSYTDDGVFRSTSSVGTTTVILHAPAARSAEYASNDVYETHAEYITHSIHYYVQALMRALFY